MNHYRTPPLLRRWLVGVLAMLIGLGPIASPVYAAVTPLADQPLNIKSEAKPNIVLTVDDSTSMLFDFLPDYVVNNYCRDGLGAMTAACGNLGATNDFTAVGGGSYKSPGYTAQQYAYPYTSYNNASGYDVSGPGAGCYPGSPPTCSAGVNPGALPGLAVYPAGPQPNWPNAGKPYEYWLLWPAPPHSALNALAYDPRITYEPPLFADGTSYPPMDFAGTTGWTQVPADPWAATITYVDLTASVNVGMWCNSDWSIGLTPTDPTDPNYGKYCRVNGDNNVTDTRGTDYTYPWAPPGFNLSASPGATTANTYAAQRVKLTSASNPADPNFVKYGALFGEQVNDGTNGTPNNWNATTEDSKFFYENENILWCDPTNPAWPQTGPIEPQFCAFAAPFNILCQGNAPGVCGGLQPPACSGSVPAACNGFTPAACNGYQPPACAGVAGPACNGFVPAACNNVQPPQCNTGPQTCSGTPQACNPQGQTCSGPFAQVCSLPGTQTCQPPVCTPSYDPPGCNLLPPDPENPCNPITICAPPVCTPDPGTCNLTGASCTIQGSDPAHCPNQPGVCSIDGQSCMSAAACATIGHCSSDGLSCQTAGNCAILGGTCSLTGAACNGTTNPCAAAGHCVTPAATICTSSAQCSQTPGTCNNPVGLSCTSAAQCQDTNGTCANPPGLSCTSAAQCTQTAGSGHCTVGGAACTLNTDCPAQNGTCNNPPAQSCTAATDCSNVNGTCNNPVGQSCTAATDCSNVNGVCVTPAAQSCSSASGCSPTPGTCVNPAGLSCTSAPQCTATPGVCCDIFNPGSCTTRTCPVDGVDLNACPFTGTCSITGALCTFPPQPGDCPSLPGPLAPSAATCSTGGVGGAPTATLFHDADTAGIVCRHNNKTSGTYTSGPYDYPSGKFLTPITGPFPPDANAASPDACPATNHWASASQHYWKTSVEWCDTKMQTAGDQWLGYGTDVGSSGNPPCQPGKDATHIYPRFYQFGAASYVDNKITPAFQRVNLDISKRSTATYTHNWVDAAGQPQTIGPRSFDEEMTNYATWFAYYRTRIQAVKTVTSLAFASLDDQYRVGFHTLSNGLKTSAGQFDPATFVDVHDFDAGWKVTWYEQLFAITIPLALETPTLDAMERIGEYFMPGGNPQLSSTDPIKLSCQKNWHMFFTDGFTNQGLPANPPGDQDLNVPGPVLPVGTTIPGGITVTGLTPGAAWPHPFQEDPNKPDSSGAADYAMKYWVTDLRPSGANSKDNVPTSSLDPASWQHLNFAAMSLGTQGKLSVANQSLTENKLAAGSLQWPQPVPTVNKPDNSGVDDLWHAAINGRGRFVNAQTADELRLGMGQILKDITNQAGSRAGVGLNGSSISAGNNVAYTVSFQPGWGGDIIKTTIDINSGLQSAPLWDAAQKLNTQLTIVPGVKDTPWLTERKIFTVNDSGNAVPFQWLKLSSGVGSQRDSLAPGQPVTGQAILEFLRGNPTNEGVAAGQFRVRARLSFGEDFLGDIVDSSPVFVGPPSFPYLEGNDPGYPSWASSASHASRVGRVYVGANDGMLHAFDDATGNESWAFVPHDLYRPDATGLGALAYQDGALPPFRHHFYVDSTPRIIDANFGHGNSDWHTLLVGGFGKGAKSYYALDVTNPESVIDEDSAATQYLWTFTNPDLGYTYGRPMIAKTRAFGGQWLVVVPSGYDNAASGQGKIFFIDAATGGKVIYKEMTTGFGSSGSPAGLAHIAGYTQDFHNQLIEQIYGGDLYGNFWRFDVSDADDSNWTVQKLAYFTDPGGNPQPITVDPEIKIDIGNGIDRWVFVGTGRLLDDSDLTAPGIADQIQTFYAIRDGTVTTPNPITTPLQRGPDPLLDLVPIVDQLNGLSAEPAKGWYDDIPLDANGNPGRIVVAPQAAISIVAYAATWPQTDPCLTGQKSKLYVRGYSFGNSALLDPGDATGNSIIASLDDPTGSVGLNVVFFPPAADGSIDVRVGVTSGSGPNPGGVGFYKIKAPAWANSHRMSWRLLGQ